MFFECIHLWLLRTQSCRCLIFFTWMLVLQLVQISSVSQVMQSPLHCLQLFIIWLKLVVELDSMYFSEKLLKGFHILCNIVSLIFHRIRIVGQHKVHSVGDLSNSCSSLY